MSESVAQQSPLPASRWSIVHPTDFSSGSRRAFAHALRIALPRGAADASEDAPPHAAEHADSKLMLVHVGRRGDAHWTDYPGIRDTLARWGILSPRAHREHVARLGIRASKVHLEGGDPVRGVLERARKARADLLVAATHRRGALTRWLRPSVAEAIARDADAPTLLIPPRARGFVDRRSGQVRLRRVLLPIAQDPRPERAFDETLRLLQRLDVRGCELRLLTVGQPVSIELGTPDHQVERRHREGDVVSTILDEAKGADLVVMTTLGRDSATDVVLGTTTERVLHSLSVPLLVIPGIT